MLNKQAIFLFLVLQCMAGISCKKTIGGENSEVFMHISKTNETLPGNALLLPDNKIMLYQEYSSIETGNLENYSKFYIFNNEFKLEDSFQLANALVQHAVVAEQSIFFSAYTYSPSGIEIPMVMEMDFKGQILQSKNVYSYLNFAPGGVELSLAKIKVTRIANGDLIFAGSTFVDNKVASYTTTLLNLGNKLQDTGYKWKHILQSTASGVMLRDLVSCDNSSFALVCNNMLASTAIPSYLYLRMDEKGNKLCERYLKSLSNYHVEKIIWHSNEFLLKSFANALIMSESQGSLAEKSMGINYSSLVRNGNYYFGMYQWADAYKQKAALVKFDLNLNPLQEKLFGENNVEQNSQIILLQDGTMNLVIPVLDSKRGTSNLLFVHVNSNLEFVK